MRFAACAALVFTIVFVYRVLLPVNPTTVALTLLLAVLAVSAAWRLRYAVFTAIVATICFNFFFLPPYGTFTIADPQNWIALLVFLLTAVLASNLAAKALRSADIANQRRREAERLYSFSQKLLLADNVVELLNAIPIYIVEIFGIKAAALFVTARQEIYRSSPDAANLDAEQLKMVSLRNDPIRDVERGISFLPLRIGVQPAGSLGVSGGKLSLETLEASGSLITTAMERAGMVEKLARAESHRQSERLRSALLDSVSHELRTPLTAIKASVTALLSDTNLTQEAHRELLTIINEESDRLNRLVGQATEMAMLDASQVELQLALESMRVPVEAAMEDCKHLLKAHPVNLYLPEDLPLVRMDVSRIRQVLVQLLENAAKYSPPGSPITITAEEKDQNLVTSVADRGEGIDDFELSMIFDKFYRGREQRSHSHGTGMGLAIAKAIVEAHGGTIGASSQLGHGSVFSVSIPVASRSRSSQTPPQAGLPN
jgi:two-component system, OmpR family, sensor histidine kinase KdpD